MNKVLRRVFMIRFCGQERKIDFKFGTLERISPGLQKGFSEVALCFEVSAGKRLPSETKTFLARARKGILSPWKDTEYLPRSSSAEKDATKSSASTLVKLKSSSNEGSLSKAF